MRIIGIGGLWSDKNAMWITVEKAFRNEFPSANFFIEEEPYLQLYEACRTRALADRIVSNHDTGEDVILVPHSFGGLIACSITNRFQRSSVVGIASIFAPHLLGLSFLVPCSHGEPRAPIVSFGGKWDYVVPSIFTRHPRSIAHVTLNSNHWQDIANDIRLAEEIATATKRHLFSLT